MDNSTIHVIPIKDLKEHISKGLYCHCIPRIEDNLVIHNAYDAREFDEIEGIIVSEGWLVVRNE